MSRSLKPDIGSAGSSPHSSESDHTRQRDAHHADILGIAAILQTTLDVERMLSLFLKEATRRMPVSGLDYRNAQEGIELSLGTRADHVHRCPLAVDNQPLGEVSFTRRESFTEGEIQRLEQLLRSLRYPLRNALMYRAALHSAHTDPLTGLYNRAAMESALQREIDLARRHNTPLSLIMLDIDQFKSINDQYGHELGDYALRAFAQCASRAIRRSDSLFRYGGEEFVILLHNTPELGALKLAERICHCIRSQHYVFGNVTLNMTVSAGVARLLQKEDERSLLARADAALYQAKISGRDRVLIAKSAIN